jgi:hypothetical protein
MNSSRCPLSTSTIDGILGSRPSPGISHQKNARNSKPENGEGNKEFLGGMLVQKQKEESAMCFAKSTNKTKSILQRFQSRSQII